MISQNANDKSAYKGSRDLSAPYSYVHSFLCFVVNITHRTPRDKLDVTNNNKGKQIHKHKCVVNTFLINSKSGIFIYGDLFE